MVKRIVIHFSQKQTPYLHWEYLNQETLDRLRIVPERGGLITQWRCKGREVLYFDEQRFSNQNKSIRGGIPILFPICGSLLDDCLLLPQGRYHLNQHGFARDSLWEISLLDDHLGIALKLSDNEITRSVYPYHFFIEIEVRLNKTKLVLDIAIYNNSKISMPFSFGLHPYFNISDLNQIEIIGLNSKCINQLNMKEENTADKINQLDEGVDFLADSSQIVKVIDSLTGHSIQLEQEYPMDLTVVWTDPPRSMICVEPWTSPRQSLMTGNRKIEIESGCKYNLRTSILYQ